MSVQTFLSKTVIDAQNPWPGLREFNEAAQYFFNGRNAESAELLRLVGQAPLTILFGKSGLGKTSLIQAGLFPELRKQNFLPVYVRLDVRDRSTSLIEQTSIALQTEILKHSIDAPAPNPGERIWEYLHRRDARWWTPKNQPLIPFFVFDQFEEVFTLGADNSDAIDQLWLDLADLIQNRIPSELARRIKEGTSVDHLDLRGQRYKAMLSFREDFLPEMEGWKAEIPSIMRNRLRLLPMSADHALQAVSGTTSAGRTHELVTMDTAREIVRFVAAAELGEGESSRNKGRRKVSDSPWSKLGVEPALLSLVCAGLNDKRKERSESTIEVTLLTETGSAIIADFYEHCVFDVPEQTKHFIEKELITEGGYRDSYPLDDAFDNGILTEPLLRLLVDRRLLRIDHQLGADRVELIHDRLTGVVREHRDRERKRILALLQRRRQRLVGFIAIVLALLGLVFGGLAYYAWNKKEEAFSRELAANATRLQENDLEASVRLALRAFQVTPTAEAEISLRNALVAYRESNMRTVFEWHKESVRCATFGPPGSNLIATSSEDGTVAIWGVEGGEPKFMFSGATKEEAEGHPIIVYQVNFHPKGKVLVSANGDGRMRAWCLDTKKLMFEVRAAEASEEPVAIRSAVFSSDGRYIVTASEDRLVTIWEAETGKKVRHLTGALGHKDKLYSAVFSPDDSLVATASADGTIRVLNVNTGELVCPPLDNKEGKPFRSAVFNPQGTLMIGVGEGTSAPIWETAGWTVKGELGGHSQVVRSAAFSSDGKWIATASGDRMARVYDTDTHNLIAEFATHKGAINSVAFSPDNLHLLTSSGDHTARLWLIQPRINHALLKGHKGAVRSVAFNPDASLVATASEDGTARIWELSKSGQVFPSVTHGGKEWISGVAFNPDGTKLITAGTDKTARIWDSRTGRELHVLRGHDAWIYSAVFSPDGHYAATVGRDGGPRLWNADDGKSLASCDGHRGRVTGVAFSKDTNDVRFATVGEDDTIRVWNWNAPVCKQVLSITTDHGWAYSVAFSHDGKRMVTGGEDKAVKIWDSRSGIMLKELKGHKGWIYRVVWEGDKIISASEDGTARVWEADTGRQISVIPATTGWWVYSAEISRSGDKVALACEDGVTIVYGPEFLTETSFFTPVLDGVRKLTPHERQAYLHE